MAKKTKPQVSQSREERDIVFVVTRIGEAVNSALKQTEHAMSLASFDELTHLFNKLQSAQTLVSRLLGPNPADESCGETL